MTELTIGQLATRAGVEPGTIRYYEREGLLERASRRPSGYRIYTSRTLKRLHFIRTAKELGFALSEIRELLDLHVDPVESCEEVRAIAEARLAGVEARIDALERIRTSLVALVTACATRTPTSECPILESLDLEELP